MCLQGMKPPIESQLFSLSSAETGIWEEAGSFEPLPSCDLSGSRLSVENILDYISNNLNQLAKKKNTRFLLLCLVLPFLQP